MTGLRGLDAWITSPRYAEDEQTAYCHNVACNEFDEPQDVMMAREYGHWFLVGDSEDGCAGKLADGTRCGSELKDDRPEWPDEDVEPEWFDARRARGLTG